MINNLQLSSIWKNHNTTIFVCFLMNMLDGMDVMVISYTAPSLAKEWDVSPEMLGLIFSTGLFGMAIGGIFLAPFADQIGRRRTIIISALIMGISVFLTCFCQIVEHLLILRFISGLGIGSMLASTATLTAEFAPKKTKDFWVSFVMAGYPLGAVFTGLLTAAIIPIYGWKMAFTISGIITFCALPLIYFFLAESEDYLSKVEIKKAIKEAKEVLEKLPPEAHELLPPFPKVTIVKNSVSSILSNSFRKKTILLWAAIFMAFATLYFLTSWIPKLATTAGLSVSLAIYAGTVFNVGAFSGIIVQGYLSAKFGLRKIIFLFLITTASLMAMFGFFKGSDFILVLFGLIGFGIQGGFVGLYSVAARLYPTEVRATGVGWAVGLGRTGAIVGPIIGGIFIAAGYSMAINFFLFSIPLIISGLATLNIQFSDSK
jgi:MFS transporter, AAHS family, 4-hydroxybenzoate transporter